jgi:hypothetical protein
MELLGAGAHEGGGAEDGPADGAFGDEPPRRLHRRAEHGVGRDAEAAPGNGSYGDWGLVLMRKHTVN